MRFRNWEQVEDVVVLKQHSRYFGKNLGFSRHVCRSGAKHTFGDV